MKLSYFFKAWFLPILDFPNLDSRSFNVWPQLIKIVSILWISFGAKDIIEHNRISFKDDKIALQTSANGGKSKSSNGGWRFWSGFLESNSEEPIEKSKSIFWICF